MFTLTGISEKLRTLKLKTNTDILGRVVYHKNKNKTPNATFLKWDSLQMKYLCLI